MRASEECLPAPRYMYKSTFTSTVYLSEMSEPVAHCSNNVDIHDIPFKGVIFCSVLKRRKHVVRVHRSSDCRGRPTETYRGLHHRFQCLMLRCYNTKEYDTLNALA
jgi:hypothetical protein